MHWIFPLVLFAALAFLLNTFLVSLAWGTVLALATWPVVVWLEKKGLSRGLSVSAVTIGLIVGFGVPALVIVTSLTKELRVISLYLQHVNRTGLPAPEWIYDLPVVQQYVVDWWQDHLAAPGSIMRLIGQMPGATFGLISGRLSSFGAMLVANAFFIFLSFLTMVVLQLNANTVMRYLDAAGNHLSAKTYNSIRRLMPLSIRGTALGLCTVAALEGVVLGVAYAIAGAPMPILLGIMTGYLALIPGGAPFSFIAVSVLLLAMGKITAAIGLMIWGSVELFLVDKFLRPKIIGNSVRLPFLAVLFGLLGGVTSMGVIGLFVGPFLVALLFEYLREIKAQQQGALLQS
jgi:predicted PurR-regulated permease PerM